MASFAIERVVPVSRQRATTGCSKQIVVEYRMLAMPLAKSYISWCSCCCSYVMGATLPLIT